jgi:hopanoid biosynthesis associated RND transporter like protein HpnN
MLVGLADFSARRPGVVLLVCVVLSIAAGGLVARDLGVLSETDELFDAALPFRQNRIEFHRAFPQLEDRVLVVVDAPTDTRARDAARWLATELRADPARFQDVFTPGDGPFFSRNGLLYLEIEALEELVDDLSVAQPFLAELSRDPSLRGLFDLLTRAIGASPQLGRIELDAVLAHVEEAVQAAAKLRAAPTSFDDLVLGQLRGAETARRFVFVQPRLDYDDFVPARPGMLRLRELLDRIADGGRAGARGRMTGDLALQFEELESVRSQAGAAGVASFVLVFILLVLSLRSVRLIVGTVAALLFGLLWTAGVAALTVGHLNVISVAFAVLFIGLAVDFGIHYSLRYRELRSAGENHADALRSTTETVGASIALCAITTAIGFFSFVPTGYRGVSELGVIAGCGMLVAVVATLTVLPAVLSARGDGWKPSGTPVAWPLPGFPSRRPVGVLVLTGALLVAAGALALRWDFDPNPLHVRDPSTEGVQTFEELLADGELHPWSAELLAPDLAAGEAVAARVRALPSVDRALTLHSYVPEEQEAKLDVLADAALLLNLAEPGEAAPEPPAEEIVAAIRGFRTALNRVSDTGGDSALARSARLLAGDVDALLAGPLAGAGAEVTLTALDESLIRPLLGRLAELQLALTARPVTLEEVPDQIRQRMVAADGRARVQVFPVGNLNHNDDLREFYDEVHAIAPSATGTSVYMVESARLISNALREAFSYAAALIALLLLVLWRSVSDTLRVLAPLGCAAILTAATAFAIGLPLNFADVIVLPLLLGIGVDTGIHLVHRHRTGAGGDVLGTSTSQAVVWSGLTTIASFGSLGFATHRGMASLGQLLTIGVVFTLAANLILLPALLALRRRR